MRLLPGEVLRADGEEMERTFRLLWRERRSRPERISLVVRCFRSLILVAALEWKDRAFQRPEAGGYKKPRRWGMSAWWRNLRYAIRGLRKAPSFAITTVVLIGLGVGAVTTIFTLVDHIVLRPLPYPSANRLFLLENGDHSGPMVREFQGLRSVEKWGFVIQETANLVGEGDPLRVLQMEVSRDFFSLFGASPVQGRLFVDEDYNVPSVAVLSYGAWDRIFGRDPTVIGRTMRVDGEPLTVVGVLSQDFVPPEAVFHGGRGADIWIPFDWSRDALQDPGYHAVSAAGRVAEGASLADVEAEVARALDHLAEVYPEQFLDDEGHQQYSTPPAALQEITTRRVRNGLGLLLGAVGLLLLVACMNVAHLFLARGIGRIQEMAVRRAFGADTPNLVQHLLVESLVLGVGGAFLGLALADVGLRTFMNLNPTAIPRSGDVTLDLRVLLFAAAVSTGTVLLFGLVPALRSVRGDLTNDLKGTSRVVTSGRSTSRMRGGLVVAEVALSLVLVASAGLLLKSFLRVQSRGTGFEVEGLWTVPLTPTWITSPAEYIEAMDRVEASLAGIPGVSEATYSLTMPFEYVGTGRCCWMTSSLTVEGQSREGIRLILQPVTETYFGTLALPILAGRTWSASEGGLEPWPVVLSERLAVELFGSAESAVGRPISIGGSGTSVQVYGVAGDDRHFGLDQDPPLFVYLPMEELPFDIPMAHMAVRIEGEAPSAWARTVREAVWAAVPDMPVPTVRSMKDWVEASTAGRRFDSVLFGGFGVMGLLLAAAGLYGTLLYTVGQRRRELGIRMALGAARNRVQRQVVSQGMALAVVGCVLGLGGAWMLGRFLESRLYEIRGGDPGALGSAVAVLLTVALMASWFPARRASRVDPMEVLREE